MSDEDHSSSRPTQIDRFEEGYAPIQLQSIATHRGVACEVLEAGLDELLDDEIDFPVEYPQPEDALLMNCRFPKQQQQKSLLQQAAADDTPIASITGLPEELEGKQPILNVSVYKGSIDATTPASSSACCEAPHNSWTRQPLQEPTKNQGDDAVDFMWVDLRSCSNGGETLLFPSLASAAYLFRSLLGTGHDSSPWCPHPRSSRSQTRQRIGVLFHGSAPDSVFDVRVGDICPSWFLYSVSRVQIPKSWSPGELLSPSTTETGTTAEPATLLIFKPLPPRPLFGLTPSAKVKPDESALASLPPGCLWEMYFEYQEADDSDDNGKDEKKQTAEKKARKIPHCRMTAPPYLSDCQDYDPAMMKALREQWPLIRDEALQIPRWTAWPETQHYSKAKRSNDDDDDPDKPFHPTWNVFPLCHCFPADKPENKVWIEQTCAFVPQTIALLKQHLGPVLRTALFSRLDPESTLEAHTGWSDLANHVIRCHLPLVVPPGGLCGTWVDGCVETHEEGRWVCFDDSKTHRAFNYSSADRIVLILDLARPDGLPLGSATGGHTDELDQFIASMNL